MDPGAEFERHRGVLFGVAYRILGSAAEAEDAVQDTWLRWSAADRERVDDPRGYLIRAVSTTALNRLRAARARRETYVGPWLPEPVITSADPSVAVELAESVSMAMLVVLETLSPLERAVFVLREVFGFGHAEIAAALGHSEASVRQVAHRARGHVAARRPRFSADRAAGMRVAEEFLAAASGGELDRLLGLLAPDVELWTDGGGKVRTALRGVVGVDKVSRFIAGMADRYQEDFTYRPAEVNYGPGFVAEEGGEPVLVASLDVDQGRIRAIRVVLNPDKLVAVAQGWSLPS